MHTPTRLDYGHGWYVDQRPAADGSIHIVCAYDETMEKGGGIIVARVSGGAKQYHLSPEVSLATANEIVRAVNSHADLVDALRNLLDDVDHHCDGDDRSMTLDVTAERARAALERAKASG